MNIQAVAILGVSIMIGALIFGSLVGIEQNRKLTEGRALALRNHGTLEQLESVLSTIKDAETEQRDFVITGQDSYLEHFNDAVIKIDPSIQSLTILVQGKPTQLARAARL